MHGVDVVRLDGVCEFVSAELEVEHEDEEKEREPDGGPHQEDDPVAIAHRGQEAFSTLSIVIFKHNRPTEKV